MDLENKVPSTQHAKLGYSKCLSTYEKTDDEIIQSFWIAPSEAYFNQVIISVVIGRSQKTLECDRWRGIGIPFRKVMGRVLYKKSDVIGWLDSFSVRNNTSQYNSKEG